MQAKFKIYPERKLMVDVLIGTVPYDRLKEMVMDEVRQPFFPKVNRIISDMRKASMNYTLEEVKDFLEFMGTLPAENDLRWALLAHTPNQTALSILISNNPLFFNLARVFYTLEACNHFLEIAYTEEEFSDPDFIVVWDQVDG